MTSQHRGCRPVLTCTIMTIPKTVTEPMLCINIGLSAQHALSHSDLTTTLWGSSIIPMLPMRNLSSGRQ